MVRSFGSDNHAGAHPDVLRAVVEANVGDAPSYGGDEWTARAETVFRRHFGAAARAYPVFNGTGANVAALCALTGKHDAVLCSDVAHIHVDECGAPERIAGVKLLPLPTTHGKITAADVARFEGRRGDEHFVRPRVVSITQATELGTVYTAAETAAIADEAHRLGMSVHLDGARLANAAAALGESLAGLTTDAGVDVVSFGATKNGLLFGDAVVFCRPELADGFERTRMQLTQLASKQRFVAAQLTALLEGDLWLRNARHANEMAQRLATAVDALPGVDVLHPVQANAVFARLGDEVCRWMCAWDTTPQDVDAFTATIAGVERRETAASTPPRAQRVEDDGDVDSLLQ